MNDPGVAQLRAQLATEKARLAQLEAELAAMSPQPQERSQLPSQSKPEIRPQPISENPAATLTVPAAASFRAIFEHAGIGIGVVDLHGNILATNTALQRFLGYSSEELRNVHFADITFPEDEAKDRLLFAQLLRGELSRYRMEKRYVCKDGSVVHGKLTGTIVRKDGVPQYVIGMVEDITGQQGALAALAESQRRFEMLVDNIDVLFWLFDVKLDREVYLSPALEKMWGLNVTYTLEQRITNRRILLETIVPEDQQPFLANMQLMMKGQAVTSEYRIVRADGEVRTIQGKGFPIYDETGGIPLIAGTATDITETVRVRKEISELNGSLEQRVQERTQELTDALAALQEQRDFSLQITESMREGVMVYDRQGVVEYANPFITELTGISREQFIGSRDLFPQLADDPQYIRDQVEARLKGHNADYEVGIRGAGGEQKYIRILATPRVQQGKLNGGIAVISDLTQRKQAEAILRTTSERLAQANRELARAARMKDEFLANVSHELRTPLTGILALSEALLSGAYGELPARQQRPLTMVEESGRHLLSLINDVLDVAKAEAGRLDIELEPVLVGDLCQASLRLVQDLAVRKGHQVTLDLPPEPLRVQADPRRLKQILVNLLSNAVKFTPEGGRLGIRVRTGSSAGTLHKTLTFTVWDEGIGIPADRVNQIFEPFVQLHSDLSRTYSGTGLGLALVRRLAALHSGSVFVESEEGRGSQFHVVLPYVEAGSTAAGPATAGSPDLPLADAVAAAITSAITPADTPADPAAAGDSADSTAPRTTAGDTAPGAATGRPRQDRDRAARAYQPSILVAEDMAVTRTALQDYLTLQGFRVLTAADGYEAIQVVSAYKPDLVLMDIQMPGMDGMEAIRTIRGLGDPQAAGVPILILTAHAMPGAREHFLSTGADGYLSKPLRLADLTRAIGELLPQAA